LDCTVKDIFLGSKIIRHYTFWNYEISKYDFYTINCAFRNEKKKSISDYKYIYFKIKGLHFKIQEFIIIVIKIMELQKKKWHNYTLSGSG